MEAYILNKCLEKMNYQHNYLENIGDYFMVFLDITELLGFLQACIPVIKLLAGNCISMAV